MNTGSTTKTSYAGMMYSHDFQLWYTYFKRRIEKEWRPEELSFLLGKPDHAYLDFEKMFQVQKFLTQESILLDRIYASSHIETMEFHREEFEVSQERLVRFKIEEDEVKWSYSIEVPWTLKRVKKKLLRQTYNLKNGKPRKIFNLNRTLCSMSGKNWKHYWRVNTLKMVLQRCKCFVRSNLPVLFIYKFSHDTLKMSCIASSNRTNSLLEI